MNQPEIFEGVPLGDDLDEIIFTQLKTGKYGRFATHVQTADAPDMTNGDWVKRALKATSPDTQLRILYALEKAIIHDDMKIRAEALVIFPLDRVSLNHLIHTVVTNLDKFTRVRHDFDPNDRFTRGIDFVITIAKQPRVPPALLLNYFRELLAHPDFVGRALPVVAKMRPDWLAKKAESYLGTKVNADGGRWDVVVQNCKDPEILTTMIKNLQTATPESLEKLRQAIQKYIVNEPYREDLVHYDAEREALLALISQRERKMATFQDLQSHLNQARTTGDLTPVINGLKSLFGVDDIHPSVVNYLEQVRLDAVPNKPFHNTQWGELAKHCLTYKAIFGEKLFAEVDDYFPAILIAGSFASFGFYVMVESGAVVVMNSDSAVEIGSDLYEGDLSTFHEALLADYSAFNIDHFLTIKRAFADTPDEDFSDLDPKEFFTKLAGALRWDLKKLYDNRYHSAFDWMLDITEENDDLLQSLAES